MLPDAGSIQESEVATLNRRNAARGRSEVTPIYTQADAVAALDAFRAIDYESWVESCRACAHATGMPATCSARLRSSSNFPMRVGPASPCAYWSRGTSAPMQSCSSRSRRRRPDLDYVICKSTYGDTDRPPVDPGNAAPASRRRRSAMRHAAGGPLLIPAFAVERTQELIVDLVDLMERGDDPAGADLPRFAAGHSRDGSVSQHADARSGADVSRCSPRRICAAPRRVEESKSIARLDRLSYHRRCQRHVRRRPHPPSSQALAVARQRHGAAGRLPGAGHARAFPRRWCQGGAHPGRRNQGGGAHPPHRRIFRPCRRAGAGALDCGAAADSARRVSRPRRRAGAERACPSGSPSEAYRRRRCSSRCSTTSTN